MAKSLYSPHPGFAMEAASAANLLERTGKSIDAWVAILKKSGPAEEKVQAAWLKKEHGITTNYAGWIVEKAAGRGGAENYRPDEMVDAMFEGGKAGLRPVYDALLKLGLSIGKDVKACPCKTIVPLYRNHVFAQIKPTTRTRIDFGLALRDTKTSKRLIDTGGFEKKDRITQRIEIASLEDIDAEVKKWLMKAYEMDA